MINNNSEGDDMEIRDIKAAYRRYAPVYDVVFGPIFRPGRKQIIDALKCRPGDRILEVGVGTGLSLPLYPKGVHVTGIDVSAEMLQRAAQRVAKDGLDQVEAVLEMDGEAMAFDDNAFDKVVAMYVVSVVPDPARLVAEMSRVCRPNGDIFIVNHFCSRHPWVNAAERRLASLSSLAGFRPNIELDEFVTTTGLEVVEVEEANMFGYWKVLRCCNHARHAANAPAMVAASGAVTQQL